jgi:phosphoglycolate phosphatase
MVGDSHLDVEGAHQNGLPAIAALYGYGEAARLAAAKPEYTAADVAGLEKLLLG